MQWGNSDKIDRDTTVTFPIAFGVIYSVVSVPKSRSVLSGSNSKFGIKSQNNKSFIANIYDNGSGYADLIGVLLVRLKPCQWTSTKNQRNRYRYRESLPESLLG